MIYSEHMKEIFAILKERLKSPSEVTPQRSSRIPSAVIIPFCVRDSENYLLFLKKRDSNYPHGGQVCFPGGCVKEEDLSLVDTALREMEEETGIPRDEIKVVGALDPVKTRSTNFIIYPFVGITDYRENIAYDTSEIEKFFYVPFDLLLKSYPFRIERYSYKGKVFETPLVIFKGEVIWGATARILEMLIGRLLNSNQPAPLNPVDEDLG